MITYLICKCHAYESKLLPRKLILELASVSNLEEFIEIISSTLYGRRISEAKSIWDIETALTEIFVDRLSALLKISFENIKELSLIHI